MQPRKPSGNGCARCRLPNALARGFLSSLLPLFLLFECLPCATLLGCCCPCSSSEAVSGSRIQVPASCCDGLPDTALSPSLPVEPQRALAAPPAMPDDSPDLSAVLVLPELPRLSPTGIRLHDPPPLILLLCTLLI